jgi:hypothetical protein
MILIFEKYTIIHDMQFILSLQFKNMPDSPSWVNSCYGLEIFSGVEGVKEQQECALIIFALSIASAH